MNRDERMEEIAELCAMHNCTEKIRKIHFDQYVDRQWHPHPSDDFEVWWKTHVDFRKHNISAKAAWNSKTYRDEFMEAKSYGAISAS